MKPRPKPCGITRVLGRVAPIFNRARILVEGPYIILFETHPDTDEDPVDWVEIVRVVDGRRDLPNVI